MARRPRGVNPQKLPAFLECLSSSVSVSREQLRKALGLQGVASLAPYVTYLSQLGVVEQVEDGDYALAAHTAALFGPQYRSKLAENKAGKEAVAHYVVESLWHDKGTLVLDAGTSTTYIALAMKKEQRCPNLLITNNIHAALELLSDVPQVRLFGGFLARDWAANTAVARPDAIEEREAELTVLTVSGLSPDAGITCFDGNQRPLKLAIIRAGLRSNSLLVVADYSKFWPPIAPIPTIFQHPVDRDRAWQSVLAGAQLVTDLWYRVPDAPIEDAAPYADNMEYFLGKFSERMTVVDRRGRPLSHSEVRKHLGGLRSHPRPHPSAPRAGKPS